MRPRSWCWRVTVRTPERSVLQPDRLRARVPAVDLSLGTGATQTRSCVALKDPRARSGEGSDDHAGGAGRSAPCARRSARTGRIPGVVWRCHADLDRAHGGRRCLRRAQGEGAGDDEAAFRTERIVASATRSRVRVPAGGDRRGRSAGRSTVSPIYEGCSRKRCAAARHRRSYEPQLIDATFALLIASTGDRWSSRR